MDRWDLEKKIAIRALKDPAFKRKLLADPKKALSEFFSEKTGKAKKTEISGQFHVKVYEEKKNEWIFSIPYIEETSGELSEKELEKLSAADLGCGVITCKIWVTKA